MRQRGPYEFLMRWYTARHMKLSRLGNRRQVTERYFLVPEMPKDANVDDNARFVAVRGIVLFTSEVIGSVTGRHDAADGLEVMHLFRGLPLWVWVECVYPRWRSLSADSNRTCAL
jgi:hypothetical protein